MISPADLQPLPVLPEEASGPLKSHQTGFVSESAVRQLLVGPLTVGRRATCYTAEDGEFAGRLAGDDSPFVRLAAGENGACPPVDPFLASDAPAETTRRAAAPQPRHRADASSPATRPWLIAIAMLLVGLLIGVVIHSLRPLGGPSPEPAATTEPVPQTGLSMASAGADPR